MPQVLAAGFVPHPIWALPFVLLLLAIAIFPLWRKTHVWWEQHHYKLLFGLALGLVVLLYYGLRGHGFEDAAPGWDTVRTVFGHAVFGDYIPFVVLLFSLYVIAGGLQLTGDLRPTPLVNTAFLALGSVAASLVGTTGAAMVLIRPLLETNEERKHVRHTVIFFIFLVANIGGCLTPLGDPPLFLGYLRGVPFLWTFHLLKPWALAVGLLLAVYFVWDVLACRREAREVLAPGGPHRHPLRLRGSINLLWLLGVVLGLVVPDQVLAGSPRLVVGVVRQAVLLGFAGLSLATTPRGLRRQAGFTYGAIGEVACLFLGIFLTMQVPIEILRAHGAALGLDTPAAFFWTTGALSGVLDNAPTYLVFFEAARTLPAPSGADMVGLLGNGQIRADLLAAVSAGAVFMGANTYLGNAPNFMVKAIAEERGVKMPDFFGYMLYSMSVLVPLYLLLTAVFFLGGPSAAR